MLFLLEAFKLDIGIRINVPAYSNICVMGYYVFYFACILFSKFRVDAQKLKEYLESLMSLINTGSYLAARRR